MKKSSPHRIGGVLIAGLLILITGCGKPEAEVAAGAAPLPPKAAASQLQQAFTSANSEVKTTAEAASQAIRTANYEQAIQSIQAIKARQNLTLEQGTAVYNSERALEAELIAGINAGDAKAKRAYELLKKSRRN